jgi:hypothetical protein
MERVGALPFLLKRFTLIDKVNNSQAARDLNTEGNRGVTKMFPMLNSVKEREWIIITCGYTM